MGAKINITYNYSVYCFDIFDTIISRRVWPEYVKKIWAKELNAMFKGKCTSEEIYALRNSIEASLCTKNEQSGKDLEFCYVNLIRQMYEELEMTVGIDLFIKQCYELELEIEKRVQFLCEDIVDEIRKLKEKGKTIYCISDFYMPVGFIHELFVYHGIDGLFDNIFVSSEFLYTKRSGKLYEQVISILNLNPENVLMIGDNEWSDYEQAKKYGIDSLHIDRSEQHDKYRIFEGEISNYNVEKQLQYFYRTCNRNEYEDLTFSLYNFVEKLFYEIKGREIKNVFFLSREGEFLKKLFDYYQGNRVKDKKKCVQTHYLMVSRKATLMVSLKSLEQESFEMIFRQYINISLYDFMSSLGYHESEQAEIGRQLSVDIYEKINDFPRSNIFVNLIHNDLFKLLYEEKRLTQKENFTKYLSTFGVDFSSESMCLVDVGWKGTIQDNLMLYFSEKQKIIGLYLGLVAPGKIMDNSEKKGLLFDCVNVERTKYFAVYNENKSIFEVVLGASHGSADCYLHEEDKVRVVTSQRKEEGDLFVNIIQPIQNRIYGLFTKIDQELVNRFYDISNVDNLWADFHARLVFLPTKKQMDIFYQIYHFENFGIFEFTTFKKKENISFVTRLKNLKRMIKLRSGFFAESFWGVIALRNAGLSMLIKPYGKYMYYKHCKKGDLV